MSVVTSVTVVADGAYRTEFGAAVVKPVDLGCMHEQEFREIDTDGYGGCKGNSHRVWGAGLNHCDWDALRAWADTLPWQLTDGGVVLVGHEFGDMEVWVYQIDDASKVTRRGVTLAEYRDRGPVLSS